MQRRLLWTVWCLTAAWITGCGGSARIDGAIDKGRAFLLSQQSEDGAFRDSLNPLFETWETILVTTALLESGSGPGDSTVQSALAFLEANEDAAGLICHNRQCREAYCLETTAEYFRLRNLIGAPPPIAALDSIGRLQKRDGGWDVGNPDVREQTGFPSVTAFVLDIGSTADGDRAKAIAHLIARQNPDGHWGTSWEYYGSKAYALWPVMRVLAEEEGDDAKRAQSKALRFMLDSQKDNGSWQTADTSGNHVSPELETALMLQALRYGEGEEMEEAMERGVNFLLDAQLESGAWDGGSFPIANPRYKKQEYLFATALSISILNEWRDLRHGGK